MFLGEGRREIIILNSGGLCRRNFYGEGLSESRFLWVKRCELRKGVGCSDRRLL